MEVQSRNAATSEFLEYIALLENELERRNMAMELAKSAHASEKASLKVQLEQAHKQLHEAREELQERKDADGQTRSIVYDMKNDFFETECLLEEELKHEKVLKDKIHHLEIELEMKDNLLDHRWKRHEKARKQLENENLILKRKATLGWMLGCLSEAYMLSEPKGEATPILRMVRSIQRELERDNVVPNGINDPLHVKLEHVEKEIRSLIQSAKAASHSSERNDSEPSKDRKQEEGPCFTLTIRKAPKSEACETQEYEMTLGGKKQEEGEEQQHKEAMGKKLQHTQDEIRHILEKLEASMSQLLQNKQQGSLQEAALPPPTGQAVGDEQQQQQLQVQERSIDDLILSKARIPSRIKKMRKGAPRNGASSSKALSNTISKPFLPPGQVRI